MAFNTATKEAMFTALRTAVGATSHYVKLSSEGATAIAAIKKASTRRDGVTGAGLDSSQSARVLVKTSDYSLPDNRRVYVTTDGSTYTAARIQSVETLADDITAIEYDSVNKGTSR